MKRRTSKLEERPKQTSRTKWVFNYNHNKKSERKLSVIRMKLGRVNCVQSYPFKRK